MKILKIILIVLFTIEFDFCFGQNCESIDTLNYINFSTKNNFPIFTSKKVLFEKMGKPTKVLHEKSKFIFFKKESGKIKKDKEIYFKVVWYKNYLAVYNIYKDSAFIQSVDFRNSSISFLHNEITINSQLTFGEAANKFKCSIDSISPYLTFFCQENDNEIPLTWDKTIKTITLYNGCKYHEIMILYFFKNKLIFLSVDN